MTRINNESSDKGFVSRWSRRKLKSPTDQEEAEYIEEETAQAIDDKQAHEAAELREQKLQELNALKDEDMPDLDTLDEHSDYSPFMSVNVSEGLRNLALRKLFQGEGYNVRDGLDEYDGDYTSFEKLDPSTITSDMRHRMEMEAEKLKEALLNEEEAELEETDSLAEQALPENQVLENDSGEEQEPEPYAGESSGLEYSEAPNTEAPEEGTP